MAKYSLRPMIVDAVRYDWSGEGQTEARARDQIVKLSGGTVTVIGDSLDVTNDYGTVRVGPGEWYVKSGPDIFGISTDALFRSTYDYAGEDPFANS
jgi:hypothetical protein